jgi:hypothetical protein
MAFACSGIGSRGGGSVALPYRPTSEVSFDGSVARTRFGARRVSMASCSSSASRSLNLPLPSTWCDDVGRRQGWKTFIRNHAPDIAAIDLFVVPTIDFKLLYGLAIIRLGRRRLVWTSATANPTSEWIAR